MVFKVLWLLCSLYNARSMTLSQSQQFPFPFLFYFTNLYVCSNNNILLLLENFFSMYFIGHLVTFWQRRCYLRILIKGKYPSHFSCPLGGNVFFCFLANFFNHLALLSQFILSCDYLFFYSFWAKLLLNAPCLHCWVMRGPWGSCD